MQQLVLGIDLGTQGLRVLAVDRHGQLHAHASRPIASSVGADGRYEQDPDEWWAATCACLRSILAELGAHQSIHGICVTATSGTVVLLDHHGQSLRPALMYADRRAQPEATTLNAHPDASTLEYRFDASYGLPKLLWLMENEPTAIAATGFVGHAADLLNGRLTGVYGLSDWSHALKTGYDLAARRWSGIVLEALGALAERLPQIIPPGQILATVSAAAAAETGLAEGIPVLAGMTDGCTSQIAGGAIEPGQWLSVLGTTLVFKGVTTTRLHDPQRRIYSHLAASGDWLPGAASNTGGETLARRYPNANLSALDQQAAQLTPTGLVCYPLERTGERFPFMHAAASGFFQGQPATPEHAYTACLEGVGYVERLAFETLSQLGAPIDGPLRVAGGGARSHVWLQIRADILNRPLLVPAQLEAAFGAAVIAAGSVFYNDLAAAARAMVRIEREVQPGPKASAYQPAYQQFIATCRERGYLI